MRETLARRAWRYCYDCAAAPRMAYLYGDMAGAMRFRSFTLRRALDLLFRPRPRLSQRAFYDIMRGALTSFFAHAFALAKYYMADLRRYLLHAIIGGYNKRRYLVSSLAAVSALYF